MGSCDAHQHDFVLGSAPLTLPAAERFTANVLWTRKACDTLIGCHQWVRQSAWGQLPSCLTLPGHVGSTSTSGHGSGHGSSLPTRPASIIPTLPHTATPSGRTLSAGEARSPARRF